VIFGFNQLAQVVFNVAKVPSSSAPISGEYPETSATRKGGQPKLDLALVQGALLNDGFGGIFTHTPCRRPLAAKRGKQTLG
jgi:hypothetical protein